MRLGDFYETIRHFPDAMKCDCIGRMCADRGFYEDICFNSSEPIKTVGELIEHIEDMIGERLTGYKGGEYEVTMDKQVKHTTDYSLCGNDIVGVRVVNNRLTLVLDYEDYGY